MGASLVAWLRLGGTWFLSSFVRKPAPSPLFEPPATEAIAEEVVSEYWKKSLQALDAARARAQAGYTIVSAIAAAFIGGAFFIGQDDIAPTTQVVAVVAAAAWLATIAFYLSATTSVQAIDHVSESDRQAGGRGSVTPEVNDQALSAVQTVQDERLEIVWRTSRANRTGLIAMILSVATAASTWFVPSASEITGNLLLAPEACRDVSFACEVKSSRITQVRLDADERNHSALGWAPSLRRPVGRVI